MSYIEYKRITYRSALSVMADGCSHGMMVLIEKTLGNLLYFHKKAETELHDYLPTKKREDAISWHLYV